MSESFGEEVRFCGFHRLRVKRVKVLKVQISIVKLRDWNMRVPTTLNAEN